MKTSKIIGLLLFLSQWLSAQDNLASQFAGLVHTPINDIFVEANNNILVATGNGLYRLQDFNIDAEQLNQFAIHKIEADDNGQTWLGLYSNQISALKKNEVFSAGISNTNMITAMLIIEDNVWIGTNDGLFMLSLKKMKEMPHYRMENSKLIGNQVSDLAIDQKGRLWIATNRGISIFDNGKWEEQLLDKQVTAMVRNGSDMWVAVEKTIQLYSSDQKWRTIAMPLNYTNHTIRDLAFDYNGNLWIAMNHLLKYNAQTGVFSVYDSNTGFNSSMALCVKVDKENQIWVGTAGSGLYKVSNTVMAEPMAANEHKSMIAFAGVEKSSKKEIETVVTTAEIPKEEKISKKEKNRKDFNVAGEGTAKGAETFVKTTEIAPTKTYGKEKSNINFLGNRLIKEGTEINVKTMTLQIAIWDGQNIDGDTVSLYYNGECILKNFSLNQNRQYFTLDINPRTVNNLVLYAHSQGMLGYTTATIAIEGQDTSKQWIVLNSDIRKCDKISFNFVY